MPGPDAKRDEEILALRWEQKTLQEIADVVQLSREGVRQILKRVGGPAAEEVRAAVESRRRHEAAAAAERIRIDLLTHPVTTVEEVAARLGMRRRDVHKHTPVELRVRLIRHDAGTSQKWSNAELLAALAVAGTYSYPLTTTAYSQLIRTGEIHGPSVPLIYERFGSWAAACRQAGIEAAHPSRGDYQSKWTDYDLIGFVRDYLATPGSRGTFDGYDLWRRSETTNPDVSSRRPVNGCGCKGKPS